MTVTNNDLSEREREILCLVAKGASNKEIAQQLSISTNTVKVHLRNIFAKIEVRSRTEAAMYAVAAGLVPSGAAAIELVEQTEDTEVVGRIADTELTPQVEPMSVGLIKSWPTLRWLFIVLFLIAVGIGVYWSWASRNQNKGQNPEALSSENILRWKTLAPMPTARSSLAVAAFEGAIFAIAGQVSGEPVGNLERYHPEQNSWQKLAAKPIPVYEVSAATVGGKIYVPGGRLSDNRVIDTLEIYDPRLDQWSQGAPLPEALCGYALAAYEGRLYLFGGWNGEKFVDKVYRYEPGSDAWFEKSPLPSPRGYAGAAVTAGGKVFVLGGFDGQKFLKENLTYLPNLDFENTNPWSNVAALPAGRYGMGVVGMADIVEVAGGIQEGNDALLSLSYLSLSDIWQEFGKLEDNTPVFPGSTGLGNYYYLIGGQIDGKPTDQNLAYQAIYTVSYPIIR